MILQLLLSVFLGFLIGLEREVHGKAVGIKTVSLITLGSTLFCLMSPSIFGGDNSRIIAQIVSGIGFLGAGVLIKNGDTVKGLTTAATIWCAAAIGCLIGISMFKEALFGSLLIIVINIAFNYFKKENESTRYHFIRHKSSNN